MSLYGLLFEDVCRFFSFFSLISCFHTKREVNKVAHCLALYVLSISNFVVWIEEVPPLVSFLL